MQILETQMFVAKDEAYCVKLYCDLLQVLKTEPFSRWASNIVVYKPFSWGFRTSHDPNTSQSECRISSSQRPEECPPWFPLHYEHRDGETIGWFPTKLSKQAIAQAHWWQEISAAVKRGKQQSSECWIVLKASCIPPVNKVPHGGVSHRTLWGMRRGLELNGDPCMGFLCRMGPRDPYTFDKLKRRLVFVLMAILTRLTNSPHAFRARGPGGRCSVILMGSSFTLSLFSICETGSGYNYQQFKGIVLAPARTNVCKIYIVGQLGAFITGLFPFNRILLWILRVLLQELDVIMAPCTLSCVARCESCASPASSCWWTWCTRETLVVQTASRTGPKWDLRGCHVTEGSYKASSNPRVPHPRERIPKVFITERRFPKFPCDRGKFFKGSTRHGKISELKTLKVSVWQKADRRRIIPTQRVPREFHTTKAFCEFYNKGKISETST